MRRIALLLLLCCLVFAQNDDTSKEEALLNELLNVAPADTEAAAEEQSVPAGTSGPVNSPELTNDESATSGQDDAPVVLPVEMPTFESKVELQKDVPSEEKTAQPENQSEEAAASVESEPLENSTVEQETPLEKAPEEVTYTPERKSVPVRQARPSGSYGSSAEIESEETRIQETPDIPNFSHKAHIEDVGAECAQCHQTIFSESVRGIKSGPSMKEICSQCHNGSDAPSELLAGFSDEKKYVKTNMPLFSHTKHNQHTEKCTVCHSDIYGKLKKIEVPPPMSRCTGCHNDRKANSECKMCHENPSKLKPKSHTSRWVYRNGHGKDARLNQNQCKTCHVERQCNSCHRGQSTFEVHQPGYRYSHGMDARQRTVNCGYCHDAEFSCAKCHERKR